MADKSLARKMKRKLDARAAIINAPRGYQAGFPGMPRAAAALLGAFVWIPVFVCTEAELRKITPQAARVPAPEGLLRILFPKVSSKTTPILHVARAGNLRNPLT